MFMKGASTVSTLTNITQDWYNATDQGSPYSGVHVLFIVFWKAFNLADHEILLMKMGNI
jgi:hypothetical protein